MSFVRSVCIAAAAAATAGVLSAPSAQAAPAAPGDRPVAAILQDLQTLYRRTEAASEAYNGTAEKLKEQRAATKKARAELRKSRSALKAGRSEAGELARQQYRGSTSGIPPSVQLLLSRDPQRAMEEGRLLKRAAGKQAVTVRKLTGGERRHALAAAKEQKALAKQRKLAKKQKSQRDAVRSRLNEVESVLSSLSGDELAQLRRLESQQMASAQQSLVRSGRLGAARAPSEGGERALRYAIDQVGKPYVWGADGPDSFDCSGLTQQAWLRAKEGSGDRAGGAFPRTSQEQWKQLDRVPLSRLRPGDLVIYFPGATHVALYAGDGKVVQAPRPGAKVKVSPIAANPILGAVRPDPGAASQKDYTPPRLPAGSSAGADTGNDT
ncbi:NlpC/P60 family protein [Streptomyces sp. ODS28]|uniref:C40 family peptidase n=1 Tax=Streptomyces sp. ODS28 TaxID=3136688 RepID=UPI0031EBD1CA